MIDDDACFRRIICENPDDVLPRRVYADWLEEWARTPDEISRVEQIRTEWNFKDDGASPNQTRMRHRLRILLSDLKKLFPKTYKLIPLHWRDNFKRCKTWTDIYNATTHPIHETYHVFVVVRHGFVESISINQKTFIDIAKRLFELQPILDVYLTRMAPRANFTMNDMLSSMVGWLRDGNAVGTFPREMVHQDIWEQLAYELHTTFPPPTPQHFKLYSNESAARRALSAACVRYGRGLAGLPDLDKIRKSATEHQAIV